MHFVSAKGILSPKGGFNVYRGCTHGCIYCDSRSECYNINHVFEDIEVKQNAPELMEDALRRKRTKCMISTGAMCDPYLHCERELKITRRCLEAAEKYGFGVCLLTKSDLILRDMDVIQKINSNTKFVAQMTLTTFDEELCRFIEPNVCTTRRRYEVLKEFQHEHIPTVVWLTPLLPFINDTVENVKGILDYCIDAGVKGVLTFDGGGMTLRKGDREYYYAALDRCFPTLRKKYEETYGDAYELPSPNADQLFSLIETQCESHGIMYKPDEIFSYLNEFPSASQQLSLDI